MADLAVQRRTIQGVLTVDGGQQVGVEVESYNRVNDEGRGMVTINAECYATTDSDALVGERVIMFEMLIGNINIRLVNPAISVRDDGRVSVSGSIPMDVAAMGSAATDTVFVRENMASSAITTLNNYDENNNVLTREAFQNGIRMMNQHQHSAPRAVDTYGWLKKMVGEPPKPTIKQIWKD